MKKLIPILLSALMLTGCAGTSNNQTNTYRQISMDEAVTMMAQERGYVILDVRRPDEFAAGHIPNAINVAITTFHNLFFSSILSLHLPTIRTHRSRQGKKEKVLQSCREKRADLKDSYLSIKSAL